MLPLLILSFALFLVGALPANQAEHSCTKDSLYTSLSRDGTKFCSEVLDTKCHVSTPTQWASYKPGQIASVCGCVLTHHCTESVTASRTASSGLPTRTCTGVSSIAASSISRGTRISSNTSSHTTAPSSSGGSQSTSGSATEISRTRSTHGDAPKSSDLSSTSSFITLTDTVSTPNSQTNSASSTTSASGGSVSITVASESSTSGGSVHLTIPTTVQSDSSHVVSTGIISKPTYTISQSSWPSSDSSTKSYDGGANNTSTIPHSEISQSFSSGIYQTSTNNLSVTATVPTVNSTTIVLTSNPPSSSASLSYSLPFTNSSHSASTSSHSGTETTPSIVSSKLTSRVSSATSTMFQNTTTQTTSASTFSETAGSSGHSTFSSNATSTVLTFHPTANITHATRTADLAKETCYHLPQGSKSGSRRAVLHNADLRGQNATIPFPYIESVDFTADGIDPLYLTLRDATEGTYFIDISNRSHIAIVDSLGNAMLLNASGVHFSTKYCRYSVSIKIDDMYQQLANLSGVACSVGGINRRVDGMSFVQTLYLRDQCNRVVDQTIRKYPLLRIGDSECTNIEVDAATGKWVFDCTFPGSDSGQMKCQSAVKNDIVEFLFKDPFGGACPDLSTVITTLEETGQQYINREILRKELYSKDPSDAQREEIDQTIDYYEQLSEILKQAFSKVRASSPGAACAIEQYIGIYNSYRSFEGDICDELHVGDLPLNMNLRAGVSHIDSIATLNWAPSPPTIYNVTIQDSSRMACCAEASVSSTDSNGICSYPPSAFIRDTGCVCGRTAQTNPIAFQYTECDNYLSKCNTNDDCATAGFSKYVCITGSCCGGGVCVDPYECAQNGSALISTGI